MRRSPVRAGVVLAAAIGAGCAADPGSGPCPRLSPDLDAEQCAAVAAMALPPSLPPARGDAHADDDAAATLGFYDFYDKGFSGAGDVRCATCHVPEYAFQDKQSVGQGVAAGTRNTPTILVAARLTVWFWDGRADSLWSQPLFAIENPREMNLTRLGLAHRVADDAKTRAQYEAAFGPLPDLSDAARFPAAGKPGDASWDAMTAADQDVIDRIAANVGKAFEAFLRKAASGPSKLDAFLAGDDAAISASARRGLGIFMAQGCATCHRGPMLSDEQFHDVGLPSRPGAAADPGRAAGLAIVAQNPFNLRGPYADPVAIPEPAPPEDPSLEVGAFRTPSLRHVVETAPYGHDGAFLTLSDLLAVHAPGLDPADRDDLIAFLATLTGAYPPPPWNFWPRTPRP